MEKQRELHEQFKYWANVQTDAELKLKEIELMLVKICDFKVDEKINYSVLFAEWHKNAGQIKDAGVAFIASIRFGLSGYEYTLKKCKTDGTKSTHDLHYWGVLIIEKIN